PRDRAGSRQVYHVFTVRSPERDALGAHLKGAGIGTGVYYPVPLHLQPAFASWGHAPGDFPVSERASREVLALPMFPGLGARGARRVCREVRRFFGKPRG
ncbi:MAG: DegT/DnrJ/EryC1/StrS family aminotransferase, partial [Elusimicrobiota bacterium]